MANVSFGSTPSANINANLTGNKASITITSSAVGTVESTITIPAGTVAFRFKLPESAGATKLYLATSATGTTAESTRYEISAGNEYIENSLNGTNPITYYVSATKNGQTLQIIYWS